MRGGALAKSIIANTDVLKTLNAFQGGLDGKLFVVASSFGVSNYVQLSNGVMVQWGLVTSTTDTAGYKHTFPIAFADAKYIIFWAHAWPSRMETYWGHSRDRTKTGCTVVLSASKGSTTTSENRAMWFAIGRWK